MKVLVIGGDGLLGSHLVRKLIDHDYKVRVLVQPGSASTTLAGLPIKKIEGDLLDEEDDFSSAVKGCKYVFHLAAITDLWADPKIVWRVNYDGTRKVVEACIRAGVERLIFTGSASSFQFGDLDNPGDEQGSFANAYRGIAYMESKHQALKLVQNKAREGELDAVIIAPTFMLGDLDYGPSSGELIRQFIRRGFRFASRGGRNFTCAKDVAAAMISALTNGRNGECYIAGGHNLTYFDFFSIVARIAGSKPLIGTLPGAVLLAAGAGGSAYSKLTGKRVALNLTTSRLSLLHTYYNSGKANEELSMPQTSIEEGIEQTISGLKGYGHI